MIHFTADSHWHHKNMVLGESAWEDKKICRVFDTLQEYDAAIVAGINDHVKEEDTLYFLGDWSFGGAQNVWEFRKQINCETIHFVLGNHDHHVNNNKQMLYHIDGAAPMIIYAHQLFTSVSERIIKKINGYHFVLDHYANRTWDKAGKGSIMLYGHTHDCLPEYFCEDKSGRLYKTMDIGIDVAFRMFKEYRPFTFEEIIEIMEERIPLNNCR